MRRLLATLLSLALVLPATAGPSSSGGSRPSGGGFSGGSSRPSSSGGSSRPSSSGGSSGFSGGSAKPSTPKGSGFSSGSTKPASAPASPPSQVSKKPTGPAFNQLAADDAKKAESRRSYEQSHEPAKTYKTAGGAEKPIKADNPQVGYLRGRLDGERWATRHDRYGSYYGGYTGRPLVMYGDPYAPYWHFELMRMGTDVAALWMFHHAATLDAQRTAAMYAQDASLQARVAALERGGVKRDPTYTPPGVDGDLMYNDEFVTASYNPTPRMVDEGGTSGATLRWIFLWIPLILLLTGLVVWLVFVKKWK